MISTHMGGRGDTRENGDQPDVLTQGPQDRDNNPIHMYCDLHSDEEEALSSSQLHTHGDAMAHISIAKCVLCAIL